MSAFDDAGSPHSIGVRGVCGRNAAHRPIVPSRSWWGQALGEHPAKPTLGAVPSSLNLVRSSVVSAELTRGELVRFALDLVNLDDLATEVGADFHKLGRLLEEVSKRHRPNPYHNWQRAVVVTHCSAWLVCRPSLAGVLPAVERFWLLIAAVCHDLDHPGHSLGGGAGMDPALLVAAHNEAASSRLALQGLRDLMAIPECDFTSTMSEEDQVKGAALLGDLIRGMDGVGFRDAVRACASLTAAGVGKADFTTPEFRAALLKALLHAADTSVTALPFEDAQRWARRMMEEVWAQSRREKALGMPVAELCDESRTPLERAQCEFLQSDVLELLVPLAKIVPELEEMVTAVRDNAARYVSLAPSAGRRAEIDPAS